MGSDANSLDFKCDWRYGFNVSPSEKGTVGYLLSWSGCGGLNLSKDVEVWNPFTGAGQTVMNGETVRCIGLIDEFKYQGGDTDPIRISCYISKGNQSNIRAKLAKPLTNTKVKMAWYIISYDESAKQWYEAVKLVSPKVGQTNVNSAEGEMQIFMDKDPEKLSETLDINVYRFEFELIPQEKKKVRVQYATGPTKRVVRQWGE
jgi:hypothetical protein